MAATPTLLSLDEYLKTSYKPDCDYIDGEAQERHVGEYAHSKTQAELTIWFGTRQRPWAINVVTEQRILVAPGRVRICDLCLLRVDAPREDVTVTPPLLCIEIMSPEDRIQRARLVLEDYRTMGVTESWLIDPLRRVAYTFDAQGLRIVDGDRLELAGTPIHLILPDLFAALD